MNLYGGNLNCSLKYCLEVERVKKCLSDMGFAGGAHEFRTEDINTFANIWTLKE